MGKKKKELGTCAVCFQQHTVTARGTLHRHGWRETGGRRVGEYGNTWQTGSCYGVGWAPFEVSCAGTEAYLRSVVFAAALRLSDRIAHLETRPEIAVAYRYDTGRRDGRGRRLYDTRTVKLHPGDVDVEVELGGTTRAFCRPERGYFSYDHEHATLLGTAQHEYAAACEEGLHLCAVIAAWKPAQLQQAAASKATVHRCYPERKGYAYGYIACGRRSYTTTEVDAEVTCSRCLKALTAAQTERDQRAAEKADGATLVAYLTASGAQTAKAIRAALSWDARRFNRAVQRAGFQIDQDCGSPTHYSARKDDR